MLYSVRLNVHKMIWILTDRRRRRRRCCIAVVVVVVGCGVVGCRRRCCGVVVDCRRLYTI